MTLIAVIVASILAVLLLIQALLAFGFIRRLKNFSQKRLADQECPRVAVVICIRGSDPTLEACLASALAQDYPDYAVHIIVDSESDPAWPLVQKIVQANNREATLQALAQPLPSCSLKCSSLIQVISGLEASYEVVALLDTDAVPHQSWLRDLVSPLTDPRVGAATGNRWISPDPASAANLAQHAWNAAAVVLMYWLKVAWGGSLAIRRSVIDEGNLLERWALSYGEDTSINPALRRLGLHLAFVPSAILMSGQDSSFGAVTDWVTRQLLSCRLHHRGWWGVVSHGASTTLPLAVGFALLVLSLVGQHWQVTVLMVFTILAYLATMALLLRWLASTVGALVADASAADAIPTGSSTPGKIITGILWAKIIYAWALLNAMFARSVQWRGILYRIHKAAQIRMTEYRPTIDVRHNPST